MSTTPKTSFVAAVFDKVVAIDKARSKAIAPYTAFDFQAVADLTIGGEHLAGHPFHMAADLLGVSPALLSGTLAIAHDSEKDLALSEPDALASAALMEGAAALAAAAAMYEAENAPAIKPADVGPGMTNATLADLLDGLPLSGLSELDRAALDEAAQRIRERQDEE